jgi:hypothetical protein
MKRRRAHNALEFACPSLVKCAAVDDGQLGVDSVYRGHARLQATAGPGISYSWRSIVKGINLLKEGLIWRVGDGSSINIWSDPWLVRNGSLQPTTPKGRNCLLNTVSELIDPVTNQWDEALVRDIFWGVDADIILATPICEDFEDFPAWHFDSKGRFSVKSAYHVYVRQRDSNVPSGSGSANDDQLWKKIWELPCLPKIIQFIWRLAHNSLPLRTNINRRGMKCDTLCPCCKRLDEDGAHLFVKCKGVTHLWKAFEMEQERIRMCEYSSPQDMVLEILAMDENKRSLACCMLWRWWLNRNKINAGEIGCSEYDLIGQVKYWAAECAMFCRKSEKKEQHSTAVHWRPPTTEIIKINLDGAFSQTTGQGGWGFVASRRSN